MNMEREVKKHMEHSEFVEKYKNGEINVHIDRSAAGFFYHQKGFMPERLRHRQKFMHILSFGGAGGAIVLFFYIKWYLALIALILALGLFSKNQKVAAKGVLEASLKYPSIYNYALSENVLRISDVKPSDPRDVEDTQYTSFSNEQG